MDSIFGSPKLPLTTNIFVIPVVGVVFFSHSLPLVFGGQTQKKVFLPSTHVAPFKHLFGSQLFASSEGDVGGAPEKV